MPTETPHNDTLFIEKGSGERLGPLHGTVESDRVILEAIHEIAAGDVLIHRRTDQADARLTVTEPGFQPEIGDVPAHYEARVTRAE
ncbi:hypothetical protein [Modicisalibacter sp. 'Wilcox']|uniref:hypothetical protein n=1 Tax=Modicisalibacter sp. 'Wilcox' TaxID=2679914 RepID=UPI0013CF7C79|nr:hypothetical protein [Modicisalibacter sp. 'Wilcox']